jgi:hypothetical protein
MREPTCLLTLTTTFCHQCGGHGSEAVASPSRQWYAGPGSPVDRNEMMRSAWQACRVGSNVANQRKADRNSGASTMASSRLGLPWATNGA